MKKNILKITDLNKREILEIFNIAEEKDNLAHKYHNILEGKILCSLFFQQSTRTQLSFQSAFLRLGGNVIGASDIKYTRSSAPYYEDAKDLGKIISFYADIAVMRTESHEQLNKFSDSTDISVISGGSAHEAHPTQALIDIFTIKQQYSNLNRLNILILGSSNHRAVKSLIKCLSYWNDITFYIISPDFINNEMNKTNYYQYHSIDDFLKDGRTARKIDIIYVTRFLNRQELEKDNVLNTDIINKFRHDTIILDPLPRSKLLPFDLDELPNSKYFAQAKNGLYIREALFIYLYQLNMI